MPTIDGNGNDNTINGDQDLIFKDDTINGLGGDDTLNGLTGNDTLNGGDGDDRLSGGPFTGGSNLFAQVDRLNGGDGDDFMVAGDFSIMAGGDDDDTYRLATSRAFLTIDGLIEEVNAGIDTIESVRSFSLTSADQLDAPENFENLTLLEPGSFGTTNADATGNTRENTLRGNSQDNELFGLSGNDRLFGRDGNDRLDGGLGEDRMEGGEGNDTYRVSRTSDIVVEGAGNGTDLVETFASFTLTANVENLTLLGGSGALPNIDGTGNASNNRIVGNGDANDIFGLGGNDDLMGGLGADTLDGGTGFDDLNGGGGSDILIVDSTGDTATGGDSTDELRSSTISLFLRFAGVDSTAFTAIENLRLFGTADLAAFGNTGANTITGNDGDNVLFGDASGDTLSGGDGNDTLRGGTGGDTMTGGAGNDVYEVDSTADFIVENGGGIDRVDSVITFALGAESNLENLRLLGTAAIDGTGNGLINVMTGNGAANRLRGEGNDDTLDGLGGIDRLEGGQGNDTYVLDDATLVDTVVELAGGGTDTATSSRVSLDLQTIAQVENIRLNGSANLNGAGSAGTNLITGNSGLNILNGRFGDDTLIGGAGDDWLCGAEANDVMEGGFGADMNWGGAGRDTASYANSTAGVKVDLTTLVSEGGHAAGDTHAGVEDLLGSGFGDTLNGTDDVNRLSGGAANDVLNGRDGGDTLEGGFGIDRAAYSTSEESVTINLATGLATGGDADGDVLTSIENLSGSDHADSFTGNGGTNKLTGLGGGDTLTGGGGNDTFGYAAASDSSPGAGNVDTIGDFSTGDRIDLRNVFDGTLTFIGAAAYSGVAGEVRFTTVGTTGAMLRVNLDTDAADEMQIAVFGTNAPVAADLLL